MKKLKRSQRAVAPKQQTTETETDETPSLTNDRLAAREKRARQATAFRNKLIDASLKQLGVTREALEKRADADFDRAKSESKARLAKLRRLSAAQRKERGSLRAQIEAAFDRVGVKEALQ